MFHNWSKYQRTTRKPFITHNRIKLKYNGLFSTIRRCTSVSWGLPGDIWQLSWRHHDMGTLSMLLNLYEVIGALIARFMGPTWGPSGADRTQVGPMLAPWTLLSGWFQWCGAWLSKRTVELPDFDMALIWCHFSEHMTRIVSLLCICTVVFRLDLKRISS